jgi:hypothetical protein
MKRFEYTGGELPMYNGSRHPFPGACAVAVLALEMCSFASFRARRSHQHARLPPHFARLPLQRPHIMRMSGLRPSARVCGVFLRVCLPCERSVTSDAHILTFPCFAPSPLQGINGREMRLGVRGERPLGAAAAAAQQRRAGGARRRAGAQHWARLAGRADDRREKEIQKRQQRNAVCNVISSAARVVLPAVRVCCETLQASVMCCVNCIRVCAIIQ